MLCKGENFYILSTSATDSQRFKTCYPQIHGSLNYFLQLQKYVADNCPEQCANEANSAHSCTAYDRVGCESTALLMDSGVCRRVVLAGSNIPVRVSGVRQWHLVGSCHGR